MLLVGPTSIVQSKFARMIVMEMGIVTTELAHAALSSMDLIVQFPFVSQIAPTTGFV